MNSTHVPQSNNNTTFIFKEVVNNSFDKDKEVKDLNSFEPFKAFSSALFMSEFQENEETLISSNSNSNSNSNKGQKDKNIIDLNISPSSEKCLTSELLQSMADDSSNIKLRKNSCNNSNDLEKEEKNLKITKKLFEQSKILNLLDEKEKENNESNIYEENINGFEYQLKFIENSVHNILPKSYKKFHKNNFYNNTYNKNNHRTSFPYSNKFRNNNYNYNKNLDEKYNYSNDKPSSVNIFYPNLINKNNCEINQNNNYFCANDDVENQILNKIQKIKTKENNYDDWICNNCLFLNRGYRKICAKCNFFRIK